MTASAEWRPRATTEDLIFAACLLASFVACSWVVLHVESPYGDLIRIHTDHLHHVRATWTFWKEGFDVYREPFQTTALRAPYPFVTRVPWPDFPVAYPPGMFVVFAFPTWLGHTYPTVAPETFAKWTLYWVVLWSHVGLMGVWRSLAPLSGGRVPLLIGIWLLHWRMCLHGFYDMIWIGCAALCIAALAEKRFGRSVVWFALAMFINYRAASIVPAAAWAAWCLLRSEIPAWRKVVPLAFATSVGLLVTWTFMMFTKGSPPHESHAYLSAMSHLADQTLIERFVWLAGTVTAAIAVACGDLLVGVTVIWATELTMLHSGHSWHGTILVGACLLVGAVRPKVPVAFLRNVLAMWMFALWAVAFDNPLYAFLNDLLVRAKFI